MTPCPHKQRDPSKPCQQCRKAARTPQSVFERPRKTAIRRSPLKQGVGLSAKKERLKSASNAVKANRKKIKQVSARMAQQRRKYGIARLAFLQTRSVCEVNGCHAPATEVHHKAGREGKLLLDESLWLPVCRKCHHEIETHPEWAKAWGYSVSRLNKRA